MKFIKVTSCMDCPYEFYNGHCIPWKDKGADEDYFGGLCTFNSNNEQIDDVRVIPSSCPLEDKI